MNIENPAEDELRLSAQRAVLLNFIKKLSEEENVGLSGHSYEKDEESGEKISSYTQNGDKIYIHYRSKESSDPNADIGMVQIHKGNEDGISIETYEYGSDAKVFFYEADGLKIDDEKEKIGETVKQAIEAAQNEAEAPQASLAQLEALNKRLDEIYRKNIKLRRPD